MTDTPSGNVDIQRELNRLEEMLLDSPRLPLSRWTLVDEEQLLDQLDLIRLNLPAAFQEATRVVQQKQEILAEAEQYAQELIAAAEQQAAQMLDETGIIRRAEMEASQVRQRIQQECEALQNQTLDDVDRIRQQSQEEIEEVQRRAIAERDQVQLEADSYADQVLQGLEQQLLELMRVVRNGRQQLNLDAPAPKPPQPKSLPGKPQSANAKNSRPSRLGDRRKP
jgi:hypothetical protein